MRYGLKEKVGFILLTGEIGAGKTTLIRYMLEVIKDQVEFAVIFNTNFSSDQLLRLILSEFEISTDATEKERHLELLYHFLIDRYANNRHVLLIIDEAQNLPDDALEDIRMLSNLQTNEHILLQIMLVGQPELKKRLASPSLRQLAQRIAVSYHLHPLTEDQTYRYVAYRIETVGGRPDLFTPEAVKLIHDNSGGIPRTINLLCDAALVYGFADDLQRIDRDTVELVLADQICILDPNCPTNHPGPPPKIESRDETGDLRSRVSMVERTVSDLQRLIEDLSREVKYDLLFKYQELLNCEREKYSRLEKKYEELLADHSGAINQTHRAAQNPFKGKAIGLPHQKAVELSSQKGKNANVHRRKTGWGERCSGRRKGSPDRNLTVDPAYIKPSLWQRIAAFHPMEKLRPLRSKILFNWRSVSDKVRTKYKNFNVLTIKLPSINRLSHGINSRRRMVRHGLFWFVVFLILISGISLFFSTKQPMTADVPSTKQFERRAAESGPAAAKKKEKESAATIIPERAIDPVTEKPPLNAFNGTGEKKTSLRHVVQAGDTLSSIAREYQSSVEAIIGENNLHNHLIYIGQILKIPHHGPAETARHAG